MNKVLLLLACTASLVAAGAIDQDVWRTSGVSSRGDHRMDDTMSHEDLMRQKFLLDVLQHVHEPLVHSELLAMADSLAMDVSSYTGGHHLDDEMLHALQLARQNALLGKHSICSISELEHMRQLVGLYRLLVQARDWHTFQRNVCYMRHHVNGVLFVNVLLLAVRDRHDTQQLVMPGLHEILPEMYVDADILRQIDTGKDWSHLLGVGVGDRRQVLLGQRIAGRATRLDMTHMNRQQLWMPMGHIEKVVLSVKEHHTHDIGLLTEDVGLKSWLQELVGEMCLKEGDSGVGGGTHTQENHHWNREGIQTGRTLDTGARMDDEIRHGAGMDDRQRGIGDNADYRTMMLRGDRGRHMTRERLDDTLPTVAIHSDRLVHVNRRRLSHPNMVGETNMNWNRKIDRMGISDTREEDNERWQHWRTIEDHMDDRQRGIGDDTDYRTMMLRGDRGHDSLSLITHERLDHALPTVDIHSDRLVHVNRRRLKDPNMVGEPNMNWNRKMENRMGITENRQMANDHWQRWGTIDDHMNDRRWGLRGGHGHEMSDAHVDESLPTMDMDIHGDDLHRRRLNDDMDRDLETNNEWRLNKPLMGDSNMGVHHRTMRSVHGDGDGDLISETADGEVLLHNLQQLIARVNIERMALGIGDTDLHRGNIWHKQQHRDDSHSTDRQLIEKLHAIEQRLEAELERQVQRIAVRHGLGLSVGGDSDSDIRTAQQVNRVIGNVLLGNVPGVGILHIIREILAATEDMHGHQTLGQIGVLQLRDPVVWHLLSSIAQRLDQCRQQLIGTRPWQLDDIRMQGVTIDRVHVDPLSTHLDASDMELTNLLPNSRIDETTSKVLVGRQARLNHRDFGIQVDISADRQRPVLMRTLLVPVMGGRTQRQHALLLDTAIIDLHRGHNTVRRNSRDLLWTARDASTMTEMYQHVMLALAGRIDLTRSDLVGQSCRFPHRLLLPRGTSHGLPMQLMIVLTPVLNAVDAVPMPAHRMCGMGLGSRIADNLPLMFPLDRGVADEHLQRSPNVHVADVVIRHEHIEGIL